MASDGTLEVVVAGGGVAGIEVLLALRDLAADRVRLTLVEPRDEFVYRALAVGEPFLAGEPHSYRLDRIAADAGARLVADTVVAVRGASREVVLREGGRLAYDRLVLALGAMPERVFDPSLTFGDPGTRDALRGVVADAQEGYSKRLAFVIPTGICWALPLYELAVMTARDVRGMGIDDLEVVLVSPEQRPLAVFGTRASAAIGELLEEAGVHFVGCSHAHMDGRDLVLRPGDRRLVPDRVITVPRLRGTRVAGVPDYHDGYIATDDHGRVPGMPGVFAAGDNTNFPVKQGGIAAQQADAVAATIAAEAGARVEACPFRPVLRAVFLAGRSDRLYLRYGMAGGEGEGDAGTAATWWPPTKIAARHLAPYLLTL